MSCNPSRGRMRRAGAHRSMTIDSWTFCHRCARMIWMSEIFRVGILPAQPRACLFSLLVPKPRYKVTCEVKVVR